MTNTFIDWSKTSGYLTSRFLAALLSRHKDPAANPLILLNYSRAANCDVIANYPGVGSTYEAAVRLGGRWTFERNAFLWTWSEDALSGSGQVQVVTKDFHSLVERLQNTGCEAISYGLRGIQATYRLGNKSTVRVDRSSSGEVRVHGHVSVVHTTAWNYVELGIKAMLGTPELAPSLTRMEEVFRLARFDSGDLGLLYDASSRTVESTVFDLRVPVAGLRSQYDVSKITLPEDRQALDTMLAARHPLIERAIRRCMMEPDTSDRMKELGQQIASIFEPKGETVPSYWPVEKPEQVIPADQQPGEDEDSEFREIINRVIRRNGDNVPFQLSLVPESSMLEDQANRKDLYVVFGDRYFVYRVAIRALPDKPWTPTYTLLHTGTRWLPAPYTLNTEELLKEIATVRDSHVSKVQEFLKILQRARSAYPVLREMGVLIKKPEEEKEAAPPPPPMGDLPGIEHKEYGKFVRAVVDDKLVTYNQAFAKEVEHQVSERLKALQVAAGKVPGAIGVREPSIGFPVILTSNGQTRPMEVGYVGQEIQILPYDAPMNTHHVFPGAFFPPSSVGMVRGLVNSKSTCKIGFDATNRSVHEYIGARELLRALFEQVDPDTLDCTTKDGAQASFYAANLSNDIRPKLRVYLETHGEIWSIETPTVEDCWVGAADFPSSMRLPIDGYLVDAAREKFFVSNDVAVTLDYLRSWAQAKARGSMKGRDVRLLGSERIFTWLTDDLPPVGTRLVSEEEASAEPRRPTYPVPEDVVAVSTPDRYGAAVGFCASGKYDVLGLFLNNGSLTYMRPRDATQLTPQGVCVACRYGGGIVLVFDAAQHDPSLANLTRDPKLYRIYENLPALLQRVGLTANPGRPDRCIDPVGQVVFELIKLTIEDVKSPAECVVATLLMRVRSWVPDEAPLNVALKATYSVDASTLSMAYLVRAEDSPAQKILSLGEIRAWHRKSQEAAGNTSTHDSTLESVSTEPKETTMSNDNQNNSSKLQAAAVELQNNAMEASYRVGARQMVKLVAEPLSAFVAGPEADESVRRRIGEFLRTDMGKILIASALSAGLSAMASTGKLGVSEHVVSKLASELRVSALAEGGDMLIDLFMEPLRQILANMALPTPEAEPPQLPPATPSASEVVDAQGVTSVLRN